MATRYCEGHGHPVPVSDFRQYKNDDYCDMCVEFMKDTRGSLEEFEALVETEVNDEG